VIVDDQHAHGVGVLECLGFLLDFLTGHNCPY
jgi:hypothetical protein